VRSSLANWPTGKPGTGQRCSGSSRFSLRENAKRDSRRCDASHFQIEKRKVSNVRASNSHCINSIFQSPGIFTQPCTRGHLVLHLPSAVVDGVVARRTGILSQRPGGAAQDNGSYALCSSLYRCAAVRGLRRSFISAFRLSALRLCVAASLREYSGLVLQCDLWLSNSARRRGCLPRRNSDEPPRAARVTERRDARACP